MSNVKPPPAWMVRLNVGMLRPRPEDRGGVYWRTGSVPNVGFDPPRWSEGEEPDSV